MELPLAIVKARARNWEIILEKRMDIFCYGGGIITNRLHYYKRLERKMELEQFYSVKLP
jgi:hypothetical protein